MIDFIEYVVSELKSKRLSKADARDLIRDYSGNAAPAPRLAMLHPLLHRNVSDIDGSRYVSSFDGSEFFLSDHQVMAEGDRAVSVLPGVACLEMVRAAVADACMGGDAGQRLRIDDVVWLKPIVVAARKDLFIALSADATEGGDRCALEFEIFSEESCADGQVQDIVHCRGSARFAACDAPARLDLRALQARMAEGELDASAVYPAYRRMGMKFGPAHQPIRRVLRGQGEAVAHLTLPEAICDTWGDYALHPSLLDGALQASIGLLRDLQCLPDQPPVPFALDSLRMYSACRQDMVVWVRHAPGGTPDDKVSRLDIDLCDSEGNVCVRLSGFCSRTLGVGSADGSRPAADEPLGLLLAAPVWKPSEKPAPAPSTGARHHVLWCGDGALGARTRSLMPHVAFREVPAQSAGLASRFIDTALGCFAAVRKIIEDKSGGDAFVHVVAPAEPAPLLSALSGLLKSAALEDPRLNGQLLLVDERMVPEQIAECIRCEVGCTQDAVLRYRDGIREVLGWQEHEAVAEPRVAFKEGGVYLVTGGLGGLGTLFAKEILRQTARAKVILTGRADASEKIEEKLRALDAPDALERRAAYHAVDLTDLAQVRRLVARDRCRAWRPRRCPPLRGDVRRRPHRKQERRDLRACARAQGDRHVPPRPGHGARGPGLCRAVLVRRLGDGQRGAVRLRGRQRFPGPVCPTAQRVGRVGPSQGQDGGDQLAAMARRRHAHAGSRPGRDEGSHRHAGDADNDGTARVLLLPASTAGADRGDRGSTAENAARGVRRRPAGACGRGVDSCRQPCHPAGRRGRRGPGGAHERLPAQAVRAPVQAALRQDGPAGAAGKLRLRFHPRDGPDPHAGKDLRPAVQDTALRASDDR